MGQFTRLTIYERLSDKVLTLYLAAVSDGSVHQASHTGKTFWQQGFATPIPSSRPVCTGPISDGQVNRANHESGDGPEGVCRCAGSVPLSWRGSRRCTVAHGRQSSAASGSSSNRGVTRGGCSTTATCCRPECESRSSASVISLPTSLYTMQP